MLRRRDRISVVVIPERFPGGALSPTGLFLAHTLPLNRFITYAAADGTPGPTELIRRSRARGFVPYVSTIGLDQVSTQTLGP